MADKTFIHEIPPERMQAERYLFKAQHAVDNPDGRTAELFRHIRAVETERDELLNSLKSLSCWVGATLQDEILADRTYVFSMDGIIRLLDAYDGAKALIEKLTNANDH